MSDTIGFMKEIAKLQTQVDALRTIQTSGIWTSWTPVFSGFSADPTANVYMYMVIGGACTAILRSGASGTSNAGTFTISAPIAARTLTNYVALNSAFVLDGSTGTTILHGRIAIASGGTAFTIATDLDGSGWTASGGKRVTYATITYLI